MVPDTVPLLAGETDDFLFSHQGELVQPHDGNTDVTELRISR